MSSNAKSNRNKDRETGARKETPLVRIFAPDKEFLEALSDERCQTMPEVLSSIIEKYKRREFFEDLAGAYAELRSDSKALSEERKEIRLYENSLLDGTLCHSVPLGSTTSIIVRAAE